MGSNTATIPSAVWLGARMVLTTTPVELVLTDDSPPALAVGALFVVLADAAVVAVFELIVALEVEAVPVLALAPMAEFELGVAPELAAVVELVIEVGDDPDTAAALLSCGAVVGLVTPLDAVVALDAAPVSARVTGKRAGSVVWMMGTNGAVVMGAPRTSPTMPTVVNAPVK